jgi:large subunit ribosomal protein L4
MAIADVVNLNKETVGQVELADSIYKAEIKPHLVYEVVRAQLLSRRAGTASTKTRAEVAFSNRKPYSQKKTGRARAGTRRSPLWRKGGTIFGPKPRDWSWRPPAKVRRAALRAVLSSKLLDNSLIVLDSFPCPQIKTKAFAESLGGLGLSKAILVTAAPDPNLELSARNLPNVKILRVEGLNCYDLLKYESLVILKDSLLAIEARLLK